MSACAPSACASTAAGVTPGGSPVAVHSAPAPKPRSERNIKEIPTEQHKTYIIASTYLSRLRAVYLVMWWILRRARLTGASLFSQATGNHNNNNKPGDCFARCLLQVENEDAASEKTNSSQLVAPGTHDSEPRGDGSAAKGVAFEPEGIGIGPDHELAVVES
ncbi:hypothetical protein EVAR_47789_1 [Eumeta japonica]|uniref:Uncharacterized protein n=1 Tax=Eumeta variegata TaxID=151549 RepID=A0A4C1XUL2_EUMVA|nr:hypothetical protein EVAR_47789_1 [Eumeta japonica]